LRAPRNQVQRLPSGRRLGARRCDVLLLLYHHPPATLLITISYTWKNYKARHPNVPTFPHMN
jgi:hypothetical protein